MAKPRRHRVERQIHYESPLYRELLARLTGNLRRLREVRGWTQEEAGERCGMVMQQYQRIEAGQMNLTLISLARLAGGFGVDPETLLAAPGQPTT